MALAREFTLAEEYRVCFGLDKAQVGVDPEDVRRQEELETSIYCQLPLASSKACPYLWTPYLPEYLRTHWQLRNQWQHVALLYCPDYLGGGGVNLVAVCVFSGRQLCCGHGHSEVADVSSVTSSLVMPLLFFFLCAGVFHQQRSRPGQRRCCCGEG